MPEPDRPSTILVGFDRSDGAFDAVALGRDLADLSGDELVVAAISVADMSLEAELAGMNLETGLQRDAEDMIQRAEKPLKRSNAWVGHSLVASSAARGLQALAESESAELIVVGASHRRHPAGVPGSTAMRLLHGAPCSVAVAARGWSHIADPRLRRIGVGFDGAQGSRLALRTAAELARRAEASLHALAVFPKPPPAHPMFAVTTHGYGEIVTAMRRDLERELDDAVSSLGGELLVEAEVVDGDPVRVLAERSRTLDLLVLGSRGYGPVRVALAGSVSARLAADSECSLIIVPRGVERAFPTGGAHEPASSARS